MIYAIAFGFRAFSPLHGLTLLVCVALFFVVVKMGLAAEKAGREPRMTRVIAMLGLGFWFVHQGHYVIVRGEWIDSLPLHICDLAGLLGPLALLGKNRLMRTMLYFWALGLTIWGLLTPVLTVGPSHVVFWFFWINHGSVLLYAIYDCAVRGYRPYAKDWGMACLVTLGYVAVIVPINIGMGWNYGYLGNVELDAKTPLALLPEWPWRIIGIEVLGALMLAHAWLPWEVVRWRQRKKRGPADRVEE